MGSTAVLMMPEELSSPAYAQRRPLHPFFELNRLTGPVAESLPANDTSGETDDISLLPDAAAEKSGDDVSEKSSGPRAKRRKVDPELDTADEEPKKQRSRKRVKVSVPKGIENHFVRLGRGDASATDKDDTEVQIPDSPPGKNTAPAAPTTAAALSQDEQGNGPHTDGFSDISSLDQQPGKPPAGTGPLQQTQPSIPESGSTKPKKMLVFNPRTGTIGSPPRPKQPKILGGKPGEGGKKESLNPSTKASSRIVAIKYGTDSVSRVEIGERIGAIISGQSPSLPVKPKKLAQPASTSTNLNPTKTTHPFFLAKAKKSDAAPSEAKTASSGPPPAPVRAKTFSSTPCSPKKPRASTTGVRLPQFGVKNSGLKFPGSRLPAWPWKDMVHVRDSGYQLGDIHIITSPLPARKSKGHAVKVPVSESIVSLVTKALEVPAMVDAVRNVNTDDFLPAPPELRLPQKHFESGSKLQSRIIPELKTFQRLAATKKTTQRKALVEGGDGIQAPPELARLFHSISTSLSAFDRFQCETASWVQKYAPTSAIEVLQPGQEAFLLRDWLQALMVRSVDTGLAETEKPKAGSSKVKGAGGAGGKKKRRKKLDAFIVSSESEDDGLDILSDEEADWSPSGKAGINRKTVVRSIDLAKTEADKIANSLVISGPHGCGKTAAVYAVAKELDFEIFEINSSNRRSGKDVLEKIGDMTRNHLVQHHPPAARVDEGDGPTIEDEVAKDLKSGKQPTMGAFFKPKATATKPKKVAKVLAPVQQKEAKKEQPKSQKQSLILLEEVDILYEEDKQFWATVIGLVVQSKRPFVMTCNDETLLPLQALRPHGIFRLSEPPREAAIDRLILIAANEGHALARQAVETLYESRNRDLRAATMDLQYWCQIGVGDRKGGQDWFYPRWPKGCDIDENNEVVRVVSQGTFQPGMNYLGRDSVVDPKISSRLVEEELLQQAWNSWGIDMGHWQDSAGFSSWVETLSPVVASPAERLAALDAMDDLAETLSVADICSCKSFTIMNQEQLDATLPEMPVKTREDLILGFMHLDAQPVANSGWLTASMAATMKSLAKSALQTKGEDLQGHSATELAPLNESQAVDSIQASFNSALPRTPAIARIDFAMAFDVIAAPDVAPLQPSSYLEPSVFDRTFELIVLDVAPYVRGIVDYDSYLQKQRLKLSTLLSEGGRGSRGSKRMRTTRSALSALEGGSRSTTRGEKWFKADINPILVTKTAGTGWSSVRAEGSVAPSSPPRSSPNASPEPSPKRSIKKARGRPRKKVVLEDSGDELGNDV
ncbi:hypothetical protein B0T24DRAFT_615547 [Lasiosphaeria ovina]|uniref:ATPase AAA-type core domain-containing protein n=1 Tax=Lasiosphaeria ovina TaxID=92902 RepID=A0AAE0NFG7_9PEZI|nr:hypothetical protein B0T24DRAFT_615547 [Lasiosphaeria ovina]